MTMNAFLAACYRDVTCGLGSMLITAILIAAFVQSTAVAPGAPTQVKHLVALHPASASHGWFGKPHPAVLVD
jgi:hypothetical protein